MQPTFSAQELGDSLNRTLKLAIDDGDASSIEEAQRLFESYRLRVRVGDNIATSATRQAMLLTVVNTAQRCFLGGVEVEIQTDTPLLVFQRGCETVSQALKEMGSDIVPQLSVTSGPLLLIGDCPDVSGDGVLRLSFDGWCAAVAPPEDKQLPENQELTLSGVLAGALGVSEAFQFVRGKNIEAARRPVALSLWKPELGVFQEEARGPEIRYLPASAWLIGLGHLGQAYLWTMSMLPYADPAKLQLVLQDTDVLQQSNLSTSILTTTSNLGAWKTRAMAAWCADRGFISRIHERHFSDDFKVQATEPKIALCGVDNPQARACLEDVGFDEVIEVGLGSQGEDYLGFRLHGFASNVKNRSAREIWGDMSAKPIEYDKRLENASYRDLAKRGLDVCGLTTLAGRAVGASFVGTVASTFCIAELIRLTIGAHRYGLLELSLRNPQLVTERILPPVLNRNVPFTMPQCQ